MTCDTWHGDDFVFVDFCSGVVLNVIPEDERIIISLQGKALPPEVAHIKMVCTASLTDQHEYVGWHWSLFTLNWMLYNGETLTEEWLFFLFQGLVTEEDIPLHYRQVGNTSVWCSRVKQLSCLSILVQYFCNDECILWVEVSTFQVSMKAGDVLVSVFWRGSVSMSLACDHFISMYMC